MKHRFIDVRKASLEVWLEQAPNGHFIYQGKEYSQTVLKLVGLHHQPDTIRIKPKNPIKFGAAPTGKGLRGDHSAALKRYPKRKK